MVKSSPSRLVSHKQKTITDHRLTTRSTLASPVGREESYPNAHTPLTPLTSRRPLPSTMTSNTTTTFNAANDSEAPTTARMQVAGLMRFPGRRAPGSPISQGTTGVQFHTPERPPRRQAIPAAPARNKRFRDEPPSDTEGASEEPPCKHQRGDATAVTIDLTNESDDEEGAHDANGASCASDDAGDEGGPVITEGVLTATTERAETAV